MRQHFFHPPETIRFKRKSFGNQTFCYWLQGYFEISESPTLDEDQLFLISLFLKRIDEPLGEYTSWLAEVISYMEFVKFDRQLIDIFSPLIQEELNYIFLHVIDPDYDATHPRERLLAIHQGKKTET